MRRVQGAPEIGAFRLEGANAILAAAADVAIAQPLRPVLARVSQSPSWAEFESIQKGGVATPLWFVAQRNGEIVGYVPAVKRVTQLRLQAAGRAVTLFNGPIIHLLSDSVVSQSADRRATEFALAREIRRAAQKEYPVLIEDLPADSTLPDALTATDGGTMHRYPASSSHQLSWDFQFPDSFVEYQNHWKTKTRQTFERRIRKLQQEAGAPLQFVCHRSSQQVAGYLAAIDDVYPKTWHFAERPQRWASPEQLRAYQVLAGAGYLRGYTLSAADKTLAFVSGYQYRGTFELAELGYDPAFEKRGPGISLLYLAIREMFESDRPDFFSFGFGDNQYKRVLGRRATKTRSHYFVSGPLARARFWALRPYFFLVDKRHSRRSATTPTEADEG